MNRRAIFLDRDGTLNRDYGYTHLSEDWEWLPGAIKGLELFARHGWLLVVASNQSGIGRGYYAMSDVKRLEERVELDLAQNGIEIAMWQYCPHLPDAGCPCRKPRPGMILEAANALRISLGTSWVLGDKVSDIEAGIAAGCHAGLILNPLLPKEAQKISAYPEIPVWTDLEQAALNINSL